MLEMVEGFPNSPFIPARRRKPLTGDELARLRIGEIRTAIQAYRDANSNAVPGANGSSTTLKSDLQPYLGTFPSCPVGNQNSNVSMQIPGPPFPDGVEGWAYAYDTGQIIINSSATDEQGTPYYTY